MRKIIGGLLAFVLTFMCVSCTAGQDKNLSMEPQVTQMKAICELAVMDCYYHTVAKFKEKKENWWIWCS